MQRKHLIKFNINKNLQQDWYRGNISQHNKGHIQQALSYHLVVKISKLFL